MWKRPVIVCQVLRCTRAYIVLLYPRSFPLWSFPRSAKRIEPEREVKLSLLVIWRTALSLRNLRFYHTIGRIFFFQTYGRANFFPRKIISIGIHPQWLSHDWRKSDFAANFHSIDWLPRSRSDSADSLKRFISTRLPSSKNYVPATSLASFIWSIQPSPGHMHSATDVVVAGDALLHCVNERNSPLLTTESNSPRWIDISLYRRVCHLCSILFQCLGNKRPRNRSKICLQSNLSILIRILKHIKRVIQEIDCTLIYIYSNIFFVKSCIYYRYWLHLQKTSKTMYHSA